MLRRGNVTRVSDTSIWCTIPSIGGPDHEWMIPRTPFDIQVGDKIICAQVSGEMESFVALAPIKGYTSNSTSILFFENAAARDAAFPVDPAVTTFVWLDDEAELQVWFDDLGDWLPISWDEARIQDIETQVSAHDTALTTLDSRVDGHDTDIAGHETRLDNHDTDIFGLQLSALSDDGRLDTIEANYLNAVSDSATIDFTKTGNSVSGSVIANSIPINDLSDVVVSSPSKYQLIQHNGTNWVNQNEGTNIIGCSYYTGGTGVSSTGAEGVLAAWTASETFNFEAGFLYELELQYAIFDSTGATHLANIQLRKGVNSTAGQSLVSFRSATATNMGGFPQQHVLKGYVKNATGGDVSTTIGPTITRVAVGGTAGTLSMYGDATYPMRLLVRRLGPASAFTNLALTATEIA